MAGGFSRGVGVSWEDPEVRARLASERQRDREANARRYDELTRVQAVREALEEKERFARSQRRYLDKHPSRIAISRQASKDLDTRSGGPESFLCRRHEWTGKIPSFLIPRVTSLH
jgi:hypothetical protein